MPLQSSFQWTPRDDALPTAASRAPMPVADLWQRLEPFARWPTQLHCFTAALEQTLLAASEIEVMTAGPGALLPLCRGRGWPSRWRIAGSREVFEPVDALCTSDVAAMALAKVLAGVKQPLQLDRVPADSPLLGALREEMRGRAMVLSRPAMGCPTLPLSAEFADPLLRFNADRRSDFRRSVRRAAEFGDVSYEVVAPRPETFDALFDEAVAVEQRSWKTGAGTAMAADCAKQAFFRTFLRAAAGEGIARIAFLRIDGRAAAMQLALEWDGRFWLFKIGFDEEFARCSPGNLLMLHTLGDAAARGLRAYELLGNIEPWISKLWTREAHPCLTLRVYPFNPAGMVALAGDGAEWTRERLRARFDQSGSS